MMLLSHTARMRTETMHTSPPKSSGTRSSRRRFLTIATSAIGGIGAAALSIPFIQSWMPSERARSGGAPVQVDLSKIEEGRQITLEWRSRPVFVVHRSTDMLARLNRPEHLRRLRDPDSRVESQQPPYAQNAVRAIREDFFIVIGVCTHLGCIPTFRPEVAPEDLGDDWPGGYFCPCHSSKFDLAGRVFKGVPAPTNLVVPPYRYLGGNIVEIGTDT